LARTHTGRFASFATSAAMPRMSWSVLFRYFRNAAARGRRPALADETEAGPTRHVRVRLEGGGGVLVLRLPPLERAAAGLDRPEQLVGERGRVPVELGEQAVELGALAGAGQLLLGEEEAGLQVVPTDLLREVGRADVRAEAAPPDDLGVQVPDEAAGERRRSAAEEGLEDRHGDGHAVVEATREA